MSRSFGSDDRPGAAGRARIEVRLDALSPSDAAAVRSLPEAMGRIEALLTAGRADAAAKFIEAERGLQT